MLKRLGVILIWLLATIGTASLTYAAVTQADRAVGDTPAGPVSGADIAAQIATTTTTAESGTTAAVTPTTVTTLPAIDVTSTTLVTTTTVASPPTTAGATTTTTTPAASHQWKTVPGVGTVGVSVAGTTVTLISASPVAPYSVEVEDDGPEKVEVKFRSGSTEYRVRAQVIDGALDWDVSQEADDD